MRGFLFFQMALTLSAAQFAGAAEADSLSIHDRLDSAVVTVSRAGDKTPVTFTMVGKDELRQANPINSLPMILSLQPSVVTYNEGGTGLGNSNMTIRGSKGSQINVTLNGITLNDAESQEVFWVNIPSLSSLISSVQLQRGLGTSANGSGAFGASVNMSTASVSQNPFASVDVSAGSWNTFETTVAAGTGLTKSGLYFNIAFSRGYTDGYIDNAKVRSKSAFGVLGWMRGNNSIRFTWLMGDQRSGITWDGIDLDMYHTDRRHNDAGLYWDEYGGEHRYDNQTDNYTQNHFQLNYTRQFGDRLTWTTTLNYTRGDGYDEYYKEDKEIADYGFPSSMTGTDGNAFSESDMIYDKKMGNDFYVINSDVRYKSSSLVLTGGVNLSRYDGDHWGKMLWVKNLGDDYDYSSFNKADSWYRNDATKKEATVFGRAEWSPNDLITAFADLQWRLVSLEMEGPDDDKVAVDYDNDWSFFNPRAGLTFNFAEGHKAYASVALGHREPGRSDIKENVKGDDISPIKPERMIDGELGYQFTADNLSLSANLYMMEYWDMLLETGKLSTSGYAIKENVPRSWRRGIELAASWAPASWLRLNANGTFSDNKIHDYVKYIGVDDGELGETVPVEYGTTTMLMSPSVTAMGKATVSPWKNSSRSLKSTTFSMDVKYVGRQYIDNTERASRKIPAYVVSNFSVSHEFALGGGHLGLTGYVNNIFNNHYYAAGWGWDSYSKSSGEYYGGIGVYPAAIVNFMFKVSYRF